MFDPFFMFFNFPVRQRPRRFVLQWQQHQQQWHKQPHVGDVEAAAAQYGHQLRLLAATDLPKLFVFHHGGGTLREIFPWQPTAANDQRPESQRLRTDQLVLSLQHQQHHQSVIVAVTFQFTARQRCQPAGQFR